MILPQSKILTLFAAVVMIPVLALPVPDDSSISDNPPLVLATDVHGPASSPQVVGKEISMSKRMNHAVDVTPETRPGELFPFLRVPPLQIPSTAPEILSVPNFDRLYPMALALNYDGPLMLEGLSKEVAMFFIDRQDRDCVYQLKKKSGAKEPSLKDKMKKIKESEFYGTSINSRRSQIEDLYKATHGIPGSLSARLDPLRVVETGVNSYYILATAKEQVDERIKQVKESAAFESP
ncbi:hypothetical protein C8R42DRAFT_692172 [Lentinula raphanica]|nr:hypothetical protein C8R42DRAFT_692172 [Lentinula raphanica]